MTLAATSPDQKVAVVDFGAQYGQLIARRVRDLHVYSEIVPCDISAEEMRAENPSAIILSGGPASVYADDAPTLNPEILKLGIPVLGFCYGQQAMAVALGGTVGHTDAGEYGPASIMRAGASELLAGTPDEQTAWMSHRDAVTAVPGNLVDSHLPRRLDGKCRSEAVRNAGPPRGAPHRIRQRHARELLVRNLRP